ncbi:hypothetical protein OG730_41340 (plasmid) [Streptomyces sp. NBC_01298]|uniref:hypothetical protein n=1 Tax=Streptomyces sp. NBC_01298 TaxID=2903817 RepID=UPI002E105A9F|nr:hypothetical protein OG730_42685 [Streptomyces sp. NBC_01298]WSK25914.1 hypothetical protein OG730_41340 [Streptomyces sp. NBC_01298]
MQDEGKLILAYAMEGSDDAAWVLHRVGDSDHTAVMDDRLDADAVNGAKEWASELLKSWGHDVDGLAWTPHRPDPSAAVDYWNVRFPGDDGTDGQ